MKNKLTLLFFLLFFSLNFSFAGEVEKLPEIPWRAIVDTQRSFPIKWTTDVSVKLFGHYSETDSLMVVNSISELNKLTENIHIGMSPYDRGNLEIYFVDSVYSFTFKHIASLKHNEKSQILIAFGRVYFSPLFCQAINIKLIPDRSKQNFLTNTLAFALYPNFWDVQQDEKGKERKETVYPSIFRLLQFLPLESDQRDELFLNEMQEFDKKLLKAVYSPNFKENLKIAQKQFEADIVIPEWLKVNPYSFLLLPFFLSILLIIVVHMKISGLIIQHITNNFLRFNVNGIILCSFFAFIISYYVELSWDLKYYEDASFSHLPGNTISGAIILFAVSIPTINLLRFFEIIIHRNTHRKLLRTVLIFLTTGLIPFSAIFAFIYFATKEFDNHEIQKLSYILVVFLIIAAFRALISYFIFKEKELIIENETKLSTLRELKTKAELNALHSRINPHFLYNSLNSIAGLAHDDADKTEHMALSLSKLFRYSINKDQSDWTTFKEEMEMVKIYLDVEKVRFDDRLNYSVELPTELENYKIPRFIIQPLVENAVKHGISKSVESGQIKVTVTKEGRKVFIAVSDSGPAFPNDLTPGFGIQSIYDKLEILYKDKFEMNFVNSPQKQVLIKLN